MNLVVSDAAILLAIELAKIDSKKYHKLKAIISVEVDLFTRPRLLKHLRGLEKLVRSWSICYSSENLFRLCKFVKFGGACNSGVL